MKSKSIYVLFVIIAVFLAGVFYTTQKVLHSKNDSVTRAKVITPKSSNQNDAEAEKKVSSLDNEKYETFVPLLATETLISTQNMDLNNDGYDDEVVLVKKVGSQFMWIVPGIYKSETGNYDRLDQIVTPFSRTRTFSYNGMDVIGDHRNALIYQGLDDDGNYVMSIFLCREQKDGSLKLVSIGDFSSDGTIFIQQTERSDSYELGISKGEAYSVWVYKSDSDDDKEGKNSVSQNQIQQEYKWNSLSGKYELSQEIKVTAKRLAAKELSRIQDGTVETFASFLDGLWYKVSNEDGNIRYVFFDYETKEIIQFIGDVQEVYEWEDSKIRHNGIYLTTVNSDIMNLHRRFDVALVNVDEIKITIRDDVRLNITQGSFWDGAYKKLNAQSSSSFAEKSKFSLLDTFAAELKKDNSWVSSDEIYTIKFTDINYELKVGELTETGIYSLMKVGEYNVIQLRSDLYTSALQEYYSMSFGTKIITEVVRKKEVERTVTDYDTITLTPVKVTPTDCFSAEGHIITLGR